MTAAICTVLGWHIQASGSPDSLLGERDLQLCHGALGRLEQAAEHGGEVSVVSAVTVCRELLGQLEGGGRLRVREMEGVDVRQSWECVS